MSRDLPVRTGALWFALLGGPIAWTAHLLASYPLVPLACEQQTTLPLNLITALTALVSAAAAATGWNAWRKLRATTGHGASRTRTSGHENAGRARFMAVAGAILALFFVYVIVVEGLPAILQDPCAAGL